MVSPRRNFFSRNPYIILILLNYHSSYVLLAKPLSELSMRNRQYEMFLEIHFKIDTYPFCERALRDQELYLKYKVDGGQARRSTS